MEAEYHSAALFARNVCRIRHLWPSLGLTFEISTTILGDNVACIALCSAHQVTATTKHIDIIDDGKSSTRPHYFQVYCKCHVCGRCTNKGTLQIPIGTTSSGTGTTRTVKTRQMKMVRNSRYDEHPNRCTH